MYKHEEIATEIKDGGVLYSDTVHLEGMQGYYSNKNRRQAILIDARLTYSEKAVVAAEELGHHKTSSGDIIQDRNSIESCRQEEQALRWAVERLIHPEDFIGAFKSGVRNRYECAEFFGVSMDFLDQAVRIYRARYGYSLKVNNEYELIFIPYFMVHRILP